MGDKEFEQHDVRASKAARIAVIEGGVSEQPERVGAVTMAQPVEAQPKNVGIVEAAQAVGAPPAPQHSTATTATPLQSAARATTTEEETAALITQPAAEALLAAPAEAGVRKRGRLKSECKEEGEGRKTAGKGVERRGRSAAEEEKEEEEEEEKRGEGGICSKKKRGSRSVKVRKARRKVDQSADVSEAAPTHSCADTAAAAAAELSSKGTPNSLLRTSQPTCSPLPEPPPPCSSPSPPLPSVPLH